MKEEKGLTPEEQEQLLKDFNNSLARIVTQHERHQRNLRYIENLFLTLIVLIPVLMLLVAYFFLA